MKRLVEEPVTTEEEFGRSVTRHPAFGQIVASRVSGHQVLYGSDFRHNAYMTIKIVRSELHRSLSRDWHFGNDQVIEVALSEAQWATFVSAPNIGSGVPCTIEHIQGQYMPRLPDPKSRVDQFRAEVETKLQDSLQQLDVVMRELDEMGLPKGKAARIKERLRHARLQLANNLPFMAEQFDEHMEETVKKAKAEVHGYMTGVVQRAGLGVLTQKMLPLQIEQTKEGEESDV